MNKDWTIVHMLKVKGARVKDRFIILIADKNHYVREFLQRELVSEGYGVRQAVNGKDILDQIYSQESIDLIIIDPDMPGVDNAKLFKRFHDRIPSLPVIVHAHSEYDGIMEKAYEWPFVEKNGNSIETLKQKIADILKSDKKRVKDASDKLQGQ